MPKLASKEAVMRVLVIEDDDETADYVGGRLKRSGHFMEHRRDAQAGLEAAASQSFDVIVIDRMLPGMDGLTALQRLRHSGDRTPALILSALTDVTQRAEGLMGGADDYLCKPFAWEELIARLHALARRQTAAEPSRVIEFGGLTLDRGAKSALMNGKRLDLVAREYDVLEYFMMRPDQVITRTMLLQDLWELHFDPGTNIVESQISRLRSKLEAAGGARFIHTERGRGYVFRRP
jgi:two-component system, OmpR family, response regulator